MRPLPTLRSVLPVALVAFAVLVLGACAPDAATGAVPTATPHARAADAAADAAAGGAADDHAHHPAPLAAHAPLPGASLLHLRDVWTDHHGAPLRLADLRGHPTVVVMFYGTCTTACPVLLRDAELIEAALPADVRAATRFLMVTFDPEADTPERLAAYAAAKGLDRERWSFLTAAPAAVRRLAGALGVRYRPDGRGGFAHTNLITVLDADGVPVARLEGLGLGPDAAVAALAAAR